MPLGHNRPHCWADLLGRGEVIKVFLIVVACLGSDHSECDVMQILDFSVSGPIECQKARIPVGSIWRREVQVKQGFSDWDVFTQCQMIMEPKK